jgi:uncharacterized protein YdhG (YjbR/CyaY superfamily)
MTKSTPARRKKTRHAITVDEYLTKIAEPAHTTLNKVRAVIRSVLPAETLEVISYGIPGFKHRKMLVWYAAFSDHCSFFPTASVIQEFRMDLTRISGLKRHNSFPAG